MQNILNDQNNVENVEMEKVVNYLSSHQGNVREVFERVPMEMWQKIFEDYGNLYKNPDDRNWNIAKLRPVSDNWCSIIDNHMDFTLAFSDAMLSRQLETLSHVRLKTLVVSISTTIIHPRKLLLFLYPDLLTNNQDALNEDKPLKFLKLVETIPDLSKCLQLKQKEVNDWENLFSKITLQQPQTLNQFWEGFTNLFLEIPYLDIKNSGGWDVINLKLILMGVRLPNLNTFKMKTTWRTMIDLLPLSFVLRHHSSVKNLHLELGFHRDELRRLRQYQQQHSTSSTSSLANVGNTQLESVIFEGGAICQVGRDTWIPVLKSQRNLRRLKIWDPYRINPFSFTELGILMKQNYLTLTSLQVMIHFEGKIDLNVFQNMSCLKTLVLHKNKNRCSATIVKAAGLPASLEKLVMHKLAMDSPTMTQIARAPQLKNLKHLEFSGMGLCGVAAISTCIPIELVYEFIEKESLEVLDLCPVKRRAKPNERANGQQMHCGRLKLRLLPKS